MSAIAQTADNPGLRPGGRPAAVIGTAVAATTAAFALSASPLWAAGVLGGALLLFLLIFFPRLYVYFYLVLGLLPGSVLQYLDDFRLFGTSGASANILGILWAVSVPIFAVYVVWKRKPWRDLPFYRPYLILIVLALPMVFLSGDWAYGVRDWVHLAAPICLSLILFWCIEDRVQLMQTVRHLFLIFAVVMATGFYQLITGTGSYDYASETYRLSGMYGVGGEVTYAVLLMYMSCLTASMAADRKSRPRTSSIVIFIFSTFLLVTSQSRAPLLAFLIAGVAMLSKSVVKVQYWLLLLVVIVCAAQFSPRVYARFGGPLLSAPTKFWEDQQISVNATQRMATWVYISNEFLDRKTLLVGRGFGFIDNYLFNELDDPVYATAVHNEYLRLLIDLGVAGVGLLIWQLCRLYRVGSRILFASSDHLARSLGTALCGMVVSFAVVALTSNMFGVAAQANLFWILVGLVLSATKWAPIPERAPSASN